MYLASAVMAALFVLGTAVQFNDPDPLLWVIVYAAAAAISAAVALRRNVPRWAPAVLGILALGWGLTLAAGVPDLGTYTHMFDAWEMKSVTIEEAREASGLVLIAAWMAVLWWRSPAEPRR